MGSGKLLIIIVTILFSIIIIPPVFSQTPTRIVEWSLAATSVNLPDVAVGPSGNVYAVNPDDRIVEKYSNYGNLLLTWSTITGAEPNRDPSGIAVDSNENVFVADSFFGSIQKWNSTGSFITEWSLAATSVNLPDVAVGPSGNVYAVNPDDNNVEKYDNDGNLLLTWSTITGAEPSRDPSGIAVDSNENVFVADSFFGSIQKWADDSDSDGLSDDEETNGIDINNDGFIDLNLQALGADPQHKDIFVEVDFMSGQQPDFNALLNVISAFQNASVSNPDEIDGINLHVEVNLHAEDPSFPTSSLFTSVIDDPIPFNETLTIDESYAINDAFFGSQDQKLDVNSTNILEAKKAVYNYALFIHNRFNTTSSGFAELFGNDLFISLGSFEGGVGSQDQQEGTFMHELGHNLGFTHGGKVTVGPAINCKPNYLSVMSYAFQFSNLVPDRPLDYSREKLLTLDETNLDETVGIPSMTPLITIFGPPPDKRAPIGGPIDWDRDGFTNNTGFSTDLNRLGGLPSGCGGSGTILVGHDDWKNIKYNFRTSDAFADGFQASPLDPFEITLEILQDMISNLGAFVSLSITIPNPFPDTFDVFGNSVAGVGNDKLLVGAHTDNTGATNAGSAYLFNATTGQLLLTINNPFPKKGDNFGISVAGVGNDKLLVGADLDDTLGKDTGSAYLFNATTGQLLLTINNPFPNNNDRFGRSVAEVGNDKFLV
ncbi:MAG: hypothetical protein IH948_03120, partial [Bacteroidetes bacterium]|nr:hypothetical protein [Bacteroidota bacterium]